MKTNKYFDSKDPVDTVIDISNWLVHDFSVEKVISKHKRLKVTIEPAESKRTVAANNFYWGIIIKGFADQIWPDYSKEMIHYTLGEAFRTTRKPQEIIDREIAEGRHKTEWYIPSTTGDNVFEFWMYCEKCLNAFFEAGGQLDIADQRDYQAVKEMFTK